MIEFVNVYKSYQKVKAASAISFQLKENNVFGVIGPEHSGKTTILKICAGWCGQMKALYYGTIKIYSTIQETMEDVLAICLKKLEFMRN